MHPGIGWHAGPASVVTLGVAALLLSGCSEGAAPRDQDSEAGQGALTVLSGSPATAGFSKMRRGEYATLDVPYVCRSSDEQVRLVGVEVEDGSGIAVTDFGIADGRTLSVMTEVSAHRLAELPQAAELVADHAVHASCAAGESDPVWVELRLQARSGHSKKFRFRYFGADGDESVTRWVPYGMKLTP